jgi:hypothetical protein
MNPSEIWLLGEVSAAHTPEGRIKGTAPASAARLRNWRRVEERFRFILAIVSIWPPEAIAK